jgi:hypothetical protein
MDRAPLKMATPWFLGAAVAGPVGVVLHELGHYGAALAFGFPDVALHFSSVSYANSEEFSNTLAAGDRAGAAAMYPLAHAGATAFAGPVVTTVLSMICAFVLAFSRPASVIAAFCAAMALTAGIRSWVGVSYMFWVRPSFPEARPFFDEINAARAFDVAVDWIVWSVIVCTVFSWILVLPRLRPYWWLKTPIVLIAPILGILVWSQVGPLVLP